jgi:DNA modification methylase
MIFNAQLPELASYRRMERGLPLVNAKGFDSLVVANTNEFRPVHRWFRFKESFSADLLQRIVGSMRSPKRYLTLLDPFCGVGTSVLSAQMMGSKDLQISAVGIERNPFVAFVAETKLMWSQIDATEMERVGHLVLERACSLNPAIPRLTSLTSGRCMSRHVAQRLLAIRDVVKELPPGALRAALMLGLASAIEPLSRVRKDGRALRIVERPRQIVSTVVAAKWREISIDVVLSKQTVEHIGDARVLVGDGRFPTKLGVQRDSVDLVVTSPPYPNNIDYSEVYKLELWLLGFISDGQKFLELRKQTFRSHPTSDLANIPESFLEEVKKGKLRTALSPLLRRTREHKEAWRERLVLGYFADLWSALHEQYCCLRKGGTAFVVVGNSLHGASDEPYLIPTDLIAGIVGQCAGFELKQIGIARALKRRLSGNHFLRESVVVLRKRNG